MAHRTFRDASGRFWDVWTVIPSGVERRRSAVAAPEMERRRVQEFRVILGDRLADGWLAFQTEGERRRLAPYPDEWAEMTDAELEALCRRAVVVAPPRRLVE